MEADCSANKHTQEAKAGLLVAETLKHGVSRVAWAVEAQLAKVGGGLETSSLDSLGMADLYESVQYGAFVDRRVGVAPGVAEVFGKVGLGVESQSFHRSSRKSSGLERDCSSGSFERSKAQASSASLVEKQLAAGIEGLEAFFISKGEPNGHS